MRWAHILAAALAALAFAAPGASAQNSERVLAPWFDSDGFYNRPGASIERVTSDLIVCRAEAYRLSQVRNTNTRVGNVMAFNADGSYNPVVSGAAQGIAAILFAIQDARYNGSIEHIEFRDCAAALGFRHYRMGERLRLRFDREPDRGFAALIAAETPAEGRRNEREAQRSYYAAELAGRAFENPPPLAAGAGEQHAQPDAAPVHIQRVAPGALASAREGMAIVVISARQRLAVVPMAGDTFRFVRVPPEGGFADLLQPAASFGVRSYFEAERRADPTLDGEIETPRYSTYEIPAGRYALQTLGTFNACLGTVSFEARAGDVLYLGDYTLRPPGLPVASLFIPMGNVRSGMDNNLRDDLRAGIGEDLEAARRALQANDTVRGELRRASYENGYRLACDGRYIGRVHNPAWPERDRTRTDAFHDAMAAAIATNAVSR
ncbi:MAG: hypothetical protein AB7J28_06320 [Hyphomonadaceae bacterium]